MDGLVCLRITAGIAPSNRARDWLENRFGSRSISEQ